MSDISNQIKERIDLAELVREYVPELKKVGANWKARCPFHSEKTASFMVSADKGIWHCFGCSRGGDAFGFIKEVEGIEFADALRLLAKRAGVKLEAQDPQKETARSRTLDILRLAATWYHKALLVAKSAEPARAYIKGRGVTDETAAAWQIGFAPDAWENVSAYLQSRGFRPQEIALAGLAIQNDRGGYYDRFRNRLMFPIADVHGTIVGFTGRKLIADEPGGKYVNTPETPVYHKSEVLYGLARAKKSIREQGIAVVVEGNMDCVSSHQANITNVVASSGTALTPEQVRLIKRYSHTICLAFDPDEAGQAALLRGLEVAWQEELTVKLITLPAGLDPDALVKKDPTLWQKAINEAEDIMAWLFKKVEAREDLTAATGKKLAARAILPWIMRLPDPIEQTHYIQQLGSRIGVDEQILRSILSKASGPKDASKKGDSKGPGSNQSLEQVLNQIAVRLLSLFIVYRDHDSGLAFSPDWLPGDNFRSLYRESKILYDEKAPNLTDWMQKLPANLQEFARAIALSADDIRGIVSAEVQTAEIRALAERLRNSYLDQKLRAASAEVRDAEARKDTAKLHSAIETWQELNKERHASL